MKRSWSIRVRTALAFAIAAMALAAAVVVFTNLMTIAGVGGAFGTPTLTPVDGGAAEGAVVRLVAVLQWQWSAVGIIGAGIVAGGVGWLVSRRMLRPIDRITATTKRISASNLHERIALTGPDDELRRLSRTVDDLLDRLESAFESQRRFVAQASHELRTPIAVQRAALQIGLHDDADPDDVRAVRDELLEQNRRTEHLVESLLLLAEADRGLGGRVADVALATIADEVTTALAGPGHEAGVTVTHEGRAAPPGPVVRGEPTLVRQVLVNLVGNAVEYNERGGSVRVTTDDGGFTVENSGPVVPADVAPLLVEPFRRGADTATSGRHSGLGLSIVASIVHAHGWTVTIGARAHGGLRVRVDVSSV